MGEDEPQESLPEWYLVVQAAKYLGVAPWDLLDRPVWWIHWALAGLSAERRAEKTLMERAKSRARSR